MLLYCLKFRENTESKNATFLETEKENQCFYQNVQFVLVKI